MVIDYFSSQAAQNLLQGVSNFVEQHHINWSIEYSDLNVYTETLIRQLKPDGIIAHMPTREDRSKELQILNTIKTPVCAVMERMNSSFPLVAIDDRETGALAAETLIKLGHKQLAIIWRNNAKYSCDRRDGFREVAIRNGIRYHEFSFSADFLGCAYSDHSEKGLFAWLKKLNKPVGLFAVNDSFAYFICQACQTEGLAVPEDISILGADDDMHRCKLVKPSLSSIRLPFHQIGYKAAEVLKQQLEGKKVSLEPMLFSPGPVINRQSTDHLQVDDPLVSQAIQFIQSKVSEPLEVNDLVNHFSVSRKLLENRFRKHLNRTPLDEIRRQKIDRARLLLVDTNQTMEIISEQCGFSCAPHLSRTFRAITGTTPSSYRRQMSRTSAAAAPPIRE